MLQMMDDDDEEDEDEPGPARGGLTGKLQGFQWSWCLPIPR